MGLTTTVPDPPGVHTSMTESPGMSTSSCWGVVRRDHLDPRRRGDAGFVGVLSTSGSGPTEIRRRGVAGLQGDQGGTGLGTHHLRRQGLEMVIDHLQADEATHRTWGFSSVGELKRRSTLGRLPSPCGRPTRLPFSVLAVHRGVLVWEPSLFACSATFAGAVVACWDSLVR